MSSAVQGPTPIPALRPLLPGRLRVCVSSSLRLALYSQLSNNLLELPDVIAAASCHRGSGRVRLGEAHVGPRELVIHAGSSGDCHGARDERIDRLELEAGESVTGGTNEIFTATGNAGDGPPRPRRSVLHRLRQLSSWRGEESLVPGERLSVAREPDTCPSQATRCDQGRGPGGAA